MAYRTDLAVEIKNIPSFKDGIEKKIRRKKGILVVSIYIKSKKAALAIKKPVGNT